jgi:triphosphatase
MAIEQEIKLALAADSVAAAIACIEQIAGGPGQLIALENIYFDTPDCALAHIKSALRLRKTAHGWLQTFKAGGGASQGLHSRHEWEMPIDRPRLEPAALLAACADHPAALVLGLALPQLQALFHTDFSRRLWHLEHAGAQIEIALDQGQVSAERDGQKRSTPICEIELELKQGETAALHSLAELLRTRVPNLTPDNVSKAQRGYQLIRA